MEKFIPNKEQALYIREIVRGRTTKEIAELYNKKYGTNINVEQIKNYKSKNKLRSGVDARFKKGNIPPNKGKHTGGGPKHTLFQKGRVPSSKRPLGSERINVDGYYEIKIGEPDKWRLKHQVVYEEHHGPIPKGYAVLFADGNTLNLNIENLILVSRRKLLILNKNKMISENPEITKTNCIISDVMISITEKKKACKKK